MDKHYSSRNRIKFLARTIKLIKWMGKSALLIGISFLIIFISVEFLIPTQPTSVFSDATIDESAQQVPYPSQPQVISSPSVPNWLLYSQEPSHSKAGQPLSEIERQYISQILGQANAPTTPLAFEQMPLFILHDTAGELSRATINDKKSHAIGPLGNGIAAYISREGDAIITRPIFFTPYRPTATVYEKAADILSEKTRDQQVRKVWRLIKLTSKPIAIHEVVNEINTHQSTLSKRAKIWLDTPSENTFDQLKKHMALDGGKTTALWAVGHICRSALTDYESALTLIKSPNEIQTLKNICQKVNSVLSTSRQRVASSVHIELIQKRGSDCWTTDTQVKQYNAIVPKASRIPENKVVPLQTSSRQAYTASQYQNLTLLYLQSALQAGYFPKITTHFWLDGGEVGKIGDHCDPRGLNLTYLYQSISEALGDPWETIYGIEPQYGLYPEQGDNVWWSEEVIPTIALPFK